MEISAGQMKQTRLAKMAKGVVAAALAIDEKFRLTYGESEPAKHENGSYKKHRKTGLPYFLRSSPYRTALVTLTYREGVEWSPDQISTLVQHYRLWFKAHGNGEAFHYVWVIENTLAGRPHYHMIIWLPQGVKPPMPDKQGWWPHGMTQAKYAVSPVGYLAKYASKEESKSGHHLPKRCRLWGYGGLRMDERGPVARALAPSWLKHLTHHESHPVKRVFERVLAPIVTPGGRVIERVERVAGWFIKAGYGVGSWFFGPWKFEGLRDGGGLVLANSGVVEMLVEDESFFIPYRSKA